MVSGCLSTGSLSGTTELLRRLGMLWFPAEGSIVSLFTNFVLEEWQPFLMVGADQGDYVLPWSRKRFRTAVCMLAITTTWRSKGVGGNPVSRAGSESGERQSCVRSSLHRTT